MTGAQLLDIAVSDCTRVTGALVERIIDENHADFLALPAHAAMP